MHSKTRKRTTVGIGVGATFKCDEVCMNLLHKNAYLVCRAGTTCKERKRKVWGKRGRKIGWQGRQREMIERKK